MREDQIARLRDLEEKLVEVVLEEADPEFWPGAGLPISDMSQQERGDRYWCKKNAAATFALVDRTMSLVRDAESKNPLTGNYNPRPTLEKEISDTEKKAAKVLEAVMSRASQAGRGA